MQSWGINSAIKLLTYSSELKDGQALYASSNCHPVKALNREPAGHAFHSAALKLRGCAKEATSKNEDTDKKVPKEKDGEYIPSYDSHNIKGKKKSGKLQHDHYALLGLGNLRYLATDDQIRKSYRDAALKHHPDKLATLLLLEETEEAKQAKKDEIESHFKLIQEAYEVLMDSTKRRIFDSTDEFDDKVPTDCAPQDFFKVFGPAFKRNARWSNSPLPDLGDENTPLKEVDRFYSTWYTFKSWREFPEEEEHDIEQAESREEKRWMETLAVTWGHQDSSSCLSALISASYAADHGSRCFLAACSEHHLLGGEGIAGRAFATKKQCFATDVAIFSKWSYPLSHYAKMFDLHAALAVPILTRGNRTVQFVLELFFPRDCLDIQTHSLTLASQLKLRFQSSPHLMVDDNQIAEEVRDAATPPLTQEDPKGKQVSFSFSSASSLENRKRKTKAEKDITLDTLRQHFAGSLKDAAKNIGVCPTTLKRICRQNGISRWPSRKIKKVGHSLRKLQVVMDSVEGVQGSLHLASFYSSFPQLQSSSSSSFPFINPTQTVHVPPKSPPSSSGSQSSSGSSTCCSSEEQQLGGFQKPALSHPQLLTLSSMHEDQRPVRVTSSLPPLPSATTPRKAKDGMKVKAMFGDSMLRMSLLPHSRLTDLRREIAKRFGMDDVLRSNFSLKYLDDDQEWVLLTCDADLEECIQVYKSSSLKETIRILVHHPLSRPSFGS